MKSTATITMSAPVLDRLRALAKKEKRSVSQQLEVLVEKHLAPSKKKGVPA